MRTIGVVIVMSWGLLACGKGGSGGSSKTTEAELYLNRIGQYAKRAFVRDTSFPVGTVAPSPATPCCQAGRSDKRCAPTPADFQDPIWQALDFRIDDPNFFQYSYTGTATEFTATAVGDPACDGSTMTFVAHGTVVNGEPTFTVEKK